MTSGPDFVTTNFTFFDCNTYSSCTQCVSSSFPCDWCVDGHRCTHDTAENCRNDILVTGVSVSHYHSYVGQTWCINSYFVPLSTGSVNVFCVMGRTVPQKRAENNRHRSCYQFICFGKFNSKERHIRGCHHVCRLSYKGEKYMLICAPWIRLEYICGCGYLLMELQQHNVHIFIFSKINTKFWTVIKKRI